MSSHVDPGQPLRVAIENDYDLVIAGLEKVLAPYSNRVTLVDADSADNDAPDVMLVDTFGRTRGLHEVAAHPTAKIVAFAWTTDPVAVRDVLNQGAAGYICKRQPPAQIVAALERIHAGEEVIAVDRPDSDATTGDWPGQAEGLTQREAEVIALIAKGMSNNEISGHLFLSINTIKSYIRSAYNTMGVARRSQAVLWALEAGFTPSHDFDSSERS